MQRVALLSDSNSPMGGMRQQQGSLYWALLSSLSPGEERRNVVKREKERESLGRNRIVFYLALLRMADPCVCVCTHVCLSGISQKSPFVLLIFLPCAVCLSKCTCQCPPKPNQWFSSAQPQSVTFTTSLLWPSQPPSVTLTISPLWPS